jgi:hypothetical protein
MDLRCPNGIKFGEIDEGLIEVKCRSSRCGAGTGVVVLHRFDPRTGILVETKRFRELAAPGVAREQGRENDSANPVAVRST